MPRPTSFCKRNRPPDQRPALPRRAPLQIGPVNPGLFTFEYEDIKTNVFGIANIPVGFFGLLKGRVSCIDTVWFDGEHWIERNYRQDGDVVYSVYIRDTADEEERARP